MKKWARVFIGALLIVILIATVALLCGGRLDDEQRIRNSLESVRMAAHRKNARLVLSEIADSYRDGFGQDREKLAENIRYWCAANLQREAPITLDDITVTLSPDKKTAEVRLSLFGGGPVKDVIKFMACKEPARLWVRYVKEDRWKISGCGK